MARIKEKRPNTVSPGLVPVLSAGKHRSPRNGACFMEFASYLAGERWSDHPTCTHPSLATLARLVNDCTTDASRSRLAHLIPSVIGMNGDDPRIALVVALRAATTALPIASEQRQRALAVGILSCERQLVELGYAVDGELGERVSNAFNRAPLAERWARKFLADSRATNSPRVVARMTDSVTRTGVLGIAQACTPGADDTLREVLRTAIADCAAILGAESIELGVARAASLQFEEAVEARRSHNAVPQRERLLSARRG